jgi:hypothetical protein
MTDHRQAMLTYNCPSTGLAVQTAIVTNSAELARLADVKLSVWCPHCAAPHKIDGRDAALGAALQQAE